MVAYYIGTPNWDGWFWIEVNKHSRWKRHNLNAANWYLNDSMGKIKTKHVDRASLGTRFTNISANSGAVHGSQNSKYFRSTNSRKKCVFVEEKKNISTKRIVLDASNFSTYYHTMCVCVCLYTTKSSSFSNFILHLYLTDWRLDYFMCSSTLWF